MGHRRRNQPSVPRVGIIGCGNIGSLWDEQDASSQVWTHAGAYLKCPETELVALSDTNSERLTACGKARGINALYPDYRDMLTQESLDILSICTPADYRYDIFEAALTAGIRFFYCEKPVAKSRAEAERLQALIQQYPDARITVNYLRRWEPGLEQVGRLIHSGELGRIQRVTANYGKGIVNNGTHLIDLLCRYFDPPIGVNTVRKIEDELKDDATLDVVLDFSGSWSRFPCYLLGSDHRCYSLFEMDIIAEKGRVFIANHQPIRFYPTVPDRYFPGYTQLQDAVILSTDLAHAMLFAVEELAALYRGEMAHSRCDFSDALTSLEVADAAIRSFHEHKPIMLCYEQNE